MSSQTTGGAWRITFAATTPFVLPLRTTRRRALSNDTFLAPEGAYQQAAKQMERPQLFLS